VPIIAVVLAFSDLAQLPSSGIQSISTGDFCCGSRASRMARLASLNPMVSFHPVSQR
jgi:hypothetical protein